MMTPSNDDKTIVDASFDEGEDVIDLGEATLVDRAVDDAGQRVALVNGPALSIGSETNLLLHSRLKAVMILAIGLTLLFLVLSFFDFGRSVTGGFVYFREFGIARLLLYGGLLAFLYSQYANSNVILRGVEILFFGIVVLFWIVQRYNVVVADMVSENTLALLADRYQAIIGLMVIMIAYGIFIPNRWQDTAKVVFTIGLAPLVVLFAIELFHPEFDIKSHPLITHQGVGVLLVNVLVAGILAVYGAGVLNAMRAEVHEARKFGQYQLLDQLGAGGMGEVYLAEHALLKRPCALKLIRSDAQNAPIALARFEREVQTTAGLTHPNTIEIYDYGRADDGTFYYVMEFLPGMSVGEMIRKHGPIPAARAIHILRQACRGLAEAHDAGLIHRDLKPDNIFLSERGGVCDFVKVLDFGLVKLTDDQEGAQLTSDHVVSGTPTYMPPEQAQGDRGLDGRSDIYALGAIAYDMLTGRPPFEGENPVAVMIAHASQEVTPPSQIASDVPEDLEQVILKCLQKKPADRFENVLELEQALSECEAAGGWDSRQSAIWWQEQSAEASEAVVG